MDYGWGTYDYQWSDLGIGTMPRYSMCCTLPWKPWLILVFWSNLGWVLWSQHVPTYLLLWEYEFIQQTLQSQPSQVLLQAIEDWPCFKWIEMDNWLTLTYSTLVYHQQLKSDMSAIMIKRIIITNCTRGNRNGLFTYIYIWYYMIIVSHFEVCC